MHGWQSESMMDQKVVGVVLFGVVEVVTSITTAECSVMQPSVMQCSCSCCCSVVQLLCFQHFDLEMRFVPQQCAVFISHLARWLRTCRFSEATFRASGASKHGKNSVSRLFYLFVHFHLLSTDSFSSDSFSSLTLPTSVFPSVHICPYCRKFDI